MVTFSFDSATLLIDFLCSGKNAVPSSVITCRTFFAIASVGRLIRRELFVAFSMRVCSITVICTVVPERPVVAELLFSRVDGEPRLIRAD